MSKTLIIAEKPSVARDIAAALGGFARKEDWLESPTAIVTSAIGHLVELHVPEAAVAGAALPVIPTSFGLQPIEKTRAQFSLIKKLLARPDVVQVVNACDAGREGELIFRLIYDLSGSRKPMRRMWLQSMTADAIRAAFAGMRPGQEFDALAAAARSRAEADWLVGINGTRAVSRQRGETSSAGRVQTPTLATVRITSIGADRFKSSGRVLTEPGWLAVYGQQLAQDEDEEKEPSLCVYRQGEPVRAEGMELKALKTKPPKPLTEATLLQAMETAGKLVDDEEMAMAMKERGLGTPATRASIIENLLNDKDGKGHPKEPYVRRDKKALVPTEKGISLIGFLESQGIEQLCSPAMTGDWEARLRQVESGAVSRDVFMRDIEKMTREIVGTIMQGAKSGSERMACACPKCQGALLASARTIDCESACGFKLWLEVARRKLSIEEATQLITTGHLAGLDGFVSTKSGKTFSAGLKLGEDFKAEFVFADRAAPGAAPSGPKLACACPACGKKDLLRNGRVIECGCGQFKLWTVVAQKQLTDAQLTALLTKGTVAVKGLTSGKGTKFDATLKLEAGGKVGFVF